MTYNSKTHGFLRGSFFACMNLTVCYIIKCLNLPESVLVKCLNLTKIVLYSHKNFTFSCRNCGECARNAGQRVSNKDAMAAAWRA